MTGEQRILKEMRKAFARETKNCIFDAAMHPYLTGALAGNRKRDFELHLAFCRRCVKVFHRQKFMGPVWQEVREAAESGAKQAEERMKMVIHRLRTAKEEWRRTPVAHYRSGNGPDLPRDERPIVRATLLDASYKPTEKSVPVEVAKQPAITEKGQVAAEFEIDNGIFEGNTISLTILAGAARKEAVTTLVTELKRPSGAESLEASFTASGLAIGAAVLPLDRIKLYIWPAPPVNPVIPR